MDGGRQGDKRGVGAARRRSRGHGPARLDGTRPRATVASKVMESGKMAGQATAANLCRPHGKRSAQARSWKPGRRRQPSGARERWKPEWGETPQGARCEARQRDRPSPRWPGTPGLQRWMSKMPRTDTMSQASGNWLYCFLRQWLCGRAGTAGSAVSRGAKLRAAGIARRAFPWRQAKRAAPRQGREGIKPSRQGAGWIPKPASTAMTSSAGSAHRARTGQKARLAGRTR